MRWLKSLSAKPAHRGLLAAALGALAFVAPAGAAPIGRISAVAESGVSPAGMVQQGLPRYLAAELARAGANGFPAGARLEVRIREIYLSHDGGLPFGPSTDFSPMPDAITGVTRLLDARGNVLLEKRAFSTSAPDSGGLGPGNEARRVDSLLRALAYWVARDIAR